MMNLNYKLKVNDVDMVLSPDESITPIEVYNIFVWRKECDINSHNTSDNDLYQRAVELGVDRFFK